MYKFYFVSDALQYSTRSDMYNHMQLLWDPYAESDAYALIGPKLKSEINKAAGLEFTILPSNKFYDSINKKKTVVVAYDDNEWLFEGVVSGNPIDFFKQQKVTCNGVLSYLCDSVQFPDKKNVTTIPVSSTDYHYVNVNAIELPGSNPAARNWFERTITSSSSGDVLNYTLTDDTVAVSGKTYYYQVRGDGQNHSGRTITKKVATKETIRDHIERLLSVHNSQVDVFKRINLGQIVNDSEVHEFESSNFRTTWEALKSDIIDEFGRYFRIRRENDNNLYLDYLELSQMESGSVPLIEFTDNMLDMNESNDDDDDIFTILLPTGKDDLTLSGLSGHDSPQYNDSNHEVDPYVMSFGGNRYYLAVSRKAINRYGYIIKPQSFSDVSRADTLYDRAVKYIQYNYDFHNEYEVKAIDMKFIGENTPRRIVVADKCRLHSQWHNVDERDLYVISIENDLLNPENDSYRIGIPTSDREAMNKTLTGQTRKNSSRSSANAANYSSGMGSVSSWLESYFDVGTEFALEMSSSFRNTVQSASMMNATKFAQDETHINLMAQKIFGIDDRDYEYKPVPQALYQDSIPCQNGWYEYVEGSYQLTADTSPQPGKTYYYYMKLWDRVSDIDVGEDGIHARVIGNYQNSIATESWVEVHEDEILAITGHLHEDDQGNIIIDSGAGMRTGHIEHVSNVRFIRVPKSQYNKNPKTSDWYERVFNTEGRWTGEGVDEATVNANAGNAYYKKTNDTVADLNKYYYYRSTSSVELVADYGIYDENNLTAGIVARTVNNPGYSKLSFSTINDAKINNQNPSQLGWYEYNSSTGSYSQTQDTTVSIVKDYYVFNGSSSNVYTDLHGDHIVIGKTSGYDQLDNNTKAKVDEYINNKKLDGTITEIASDVVTVNALFANYIRTDYLESETNRLGTIYADNMMARQGIISMHDIYINFGNNLSPVGVGVAVSTGIHTFGTATYSGNNVSIPYWTLGHLQSKNPNDPSGYITFRRATTLTGAWSGGVYTVSASPQGVSNSTYLSGLMEVPNTTDGWDDNIYRSHIAYLNSQSDQTKKNTGYQVSVDATARYTAGQNAVTLTSANWNSVSTITASRTVSVSTSGRPTQLSQSKTVHLTVGSWSNGIIPIYIRDGSTSGTIVAQNSVSAPAATVSAGTWSNGKVTVTAKHGTMNLGSTSVTIPAVTIAAGTWSNGTVQVSATHGTHTAGTNYIAMPNVTLSFDCTDLGNPTYDSNDPHKYNGKTVDAKAKHGTAEKGSGSQIIWLTTGSFSNGRAAINARMTDENGKLISRDWISLPTTASWSYSYISTSVGYQINCTVGGKTYTTTHKF